MKSILLAIIGICFCSILFGQDTIVLRNGNEIRAKVLETGVNEIKYNNFNDPDGLIFYLSKSDIFMIKYQNGTKTVMNQNVNNEQNKTDLFKEESQADNHDATKFFIGYDLFKACINENSLTFGYKLTKNQFITFSPGFTYFNEGLRSAFKDWSPSQDQDPIFVYKGPTMRASINSIVYHSFYMGLNIFYKYLYYTDYFFADGINDAGENDFIRRENEKVFGFQIGMGWMLNSKKSRLFFNPSFGLGITNRSRNYTTTYSRSGNGMSAAPPLGTYSDDEENVSFILNLIIGIRIGKQN